MDPLHSKADERTGRAEARSAAPPSRRVFRRQAIVRYLEPPPRPAAPPPPRTFAGLWLLVAALVAAGLLVAWLLAGRLGYLSGEAGEAASAGPQISRLGVWPDG